MMSVIRPALAVARPISDQRVIDGLEVGARHMRQDEVLLVADADLVEAVVLGKIGDRLHLAVGGVARRPADRLQRDRHRRIVGVLVRGDVLGEPVAERARVQPGKPDCLVALGRGPPAAAARNRRGWRATSASGSLSSPSFSACQLGLDLAGQLLGAGLVDEDLDARLVLVVAAAVQIVDAQDRRRCRRAGRSSGRKSRIFLAIIGVRPCPPPT